jgi:hypothetical protein
MGIDFVLDTAKRIALFALLIAILSLAVVTLLDALGGFATDAVIAVGAFGILPYFIPSNFTTVLGTIIAVKTAGTVYVLALQLLGWKADILA